MQNFSFKQVVKNYFGLMREGDPEPPDPPPGSATESSSPFEHVFTWKYATYQMESFRSSSGLPSSSK